MKMRSSLAIAVALVLASPVYTQSEKHPAGLVGIKVISSGENIGEVMEVLIDEQGNATYAVISHGAMMGTGIKRIAVPWVTVMSALQDNKLFMYRSQLEDAPVLPRGKMPEAASGTWSREADTYWRDKISARPADMSLTPVAVTTKVRN